MVPDWLPVVVIPTAALFTIFCWVAGSRALRSVSDGREAERRRLDGALTPRALEKMIWERTNLPAVGDKSRSTGLGYLLDRVEKDESVLWKVEAGLKAERARSEQLARELAATQDALAATVRRVEALEASQRGSRLRSLLR